MSIERIGGSDAAKKYYANLAERHDYYSESGASRGFWWGRGAKELRLAGNVDPEVFKNLLDGKSPDGKRHLVQRRTGDVMKRRAGFDFTFSPPKSFSAAWSVADPETRSKLDQILKQSLLKALEAVQELCGKTRRGKDTKIIESSHLIFAVFSHDTSRGMPGELPDAQRHFHCVCPNVTVRQDGTTGTIDSRFIYKKRLSVAIGTMFRAELSKRLEQIGFQTYRPTKEHSDEKKSWFELSCVPKKLIEALSQRRKAIEIWLRKNSASGAKASEQAALETRSAKAAFKTDQLFSHWRRLGKKFGLTAQSLNQLLDAEQSDQFHPGKEKRQAVWLALSDLMKTKARFTDIELLEKTAIHAQCRGVGVKDIMSAVDEILTHSTELVRLQDDTSGTRTFTTREMLRLERRMLAGAEHLNATYGCQVPGITANTVLNRHSTIRPEQVKAVQHITSGSNLACVQGVAGTGKTFMLGVAAEIYEEHGFEMVGTALAAKAAQGLQEGSGIQSIHLHKLLHDLEKGYRHLNSKSVVVLDEAGMVGTRQMQKLLEYVMGNDAKLILVGDWEQLQAIDAGSAFRGIAQQIGYASMSQITRQRERWAREAVHQFRQGKAEQALVEFARKDRLFVGADRNEAINRLVFDWSRSILNPIDMRKSLAFAGMNNDVRELNKRMQAKRVALGQLGSQSVEVNGYDFHIGDRIMANRNYSPLALQNGAMGFVTKLENKTVYIRWDNGISVEIDTSEFSELSLAYAVSVHKGQGMTVDHSFVLAGDAMTDREWTYVSGSRSRDKTMLYSDLISGGESLAELAQLMNRSRQKELAHEYLIQGS